MFGPREPVHFNIVLGSLSASREWERCLVLLEHDMPNAGLQPDAYSYSAAISACAKAGQPSHAIALFKAMCAGGVPPNQVTCNTVLSACQRAKQPQELLALFASMPSLGVQPGAWAYSAAISAFAETGRPQEALALFRAMPPSVRPEQHCFAAAMGACRRAGEWEEVLRLYAQLLASGVEPYSHTLNAAVSACAASPKLGWRSALRLLAQAPPVRSRADRKKAGRARGVHLIGIDDGLRLLGRMQVPRAYRTRLEVRAPAREGERAATERARRAKPPTAAASAAASAAGPARSRRWARVPRGCAC